MKQTKKILIADDHPIFRQGLRAILEQDPEIRVIGEAENGDSVLAQLKYLEPDITLLDLAMPGKDGLQTLQLARADYPKLNIIIVTSYNETAYLDKAMELGARGYMLKDDAGESLLTCIRAVIRGETFISPIFGRSCPSLPLPDSKDTSSLETLTRMECRVLSLVGQFMTSKEIANRLNISYRTVQNHRSHIAQKLNLKGIHQLANFANMHHESLNRYLVEE